MIKIFLSIILISLSTFSEPLNKIEGKIVRVIDGDTVIILDSSNDQHRIRLDGIDAPESGQPYGNKATEFVKEITREKKIVVEWRKKDRYNRILGVVYADGMNVNKALLENGLAWHYKFFNNDADLAKLELQARKVKLNIWSETNPVEPYLWRKNKKKK